VVQVSYLHKLIYLLVDIDNKRSVQSHVHGLFTNAVYKLS